MSPIWPICSISPQIFNQDLSSWDTSNVTYMAGMFEGAYDLQPGSFSWDTSNVTDMSNMFYRQT